MDNFKEEIKQYADRIAALNTRELREKELQKIFGEIEARTYGVGQPLRDELIQLYLRNLRKALLKHGFSFRTLGLEKRGGLEWLTESNSVGNEEALELMRMVAKGPGK
ncbi:TPA: hypothetical protein QCD44_004253 [Enterobacter hormaechei]|nr:hypothetical protein [Enterobacter hormaechei]HBM2532112.1 hypothetical protein [Enterobacter hormaechei]HBM2648607.1 hypothetical protein [Enterobacter hormaechei]HDR1967023.1 hypothetical protein [Enterobacter hormaechei]HDR1971592.1 hypothetical protein [Enterobacter hormaechei]